MEILSVFHLPVFHLSAELVQFHARTTMWTTAKSQFDSRHSGDFSVFVLPSDQLWGAAQPLALSPEVKWSEREAYH
jgi:hypothetical protein